MSRRLLALDLDGTLLDDQGRLGFETARVLRTLRDRGHVVSFVTGRGEVDMLHCTHLYGHADYMLMNSGGRLLDLATGVSLFCEKIPPEAAFCLAEYCLGEGLQLYAMLGPKYAVTKLTPNVEGYAQSVGVRPSIFTRPEDLPLGAVESFMSCENSDLVGRYIRALGFPLRCTASEPGCYDITPERAEKWNGLRRLAALLKIPESDTLAVGNYDNDIRMIRSAGIGVAVANATNLVKASADYVTTRSNNEDVMVEVGSVFFAS